MTRSWRPRLVHYLVLIGVIVYTVTAVTLAGLIPVQPRLRIPVGRGLEPVLFFPDGQRFLVWGRSGQGICQIWDARAGTAVGSLGEWNHYYITAMLPTSGKTLVLGRKTDRYPIRLLEVFDLETLKLMWTHEYDFLRRPPLPLPVPPQGKLTTPGFVTNSTIIAHVRSGPDRLVIAWEHETPLWGHLPDWLRGRLGLLFPERRSLHIVEYDERDRPTGPALIVPKNNVLGLIAAPQHLVIGYSVGAEDWLLIYDLPPRRAWGFVLPLALIPTAAYALLAAMILWLVHQRRRRAAYLTRAD